MKNPLKSLKQVFDENGGFREALATGGMSVLTGPKKGKNAVPADCCSKTGEKKPSGQCCNGPQCKPKP